MLQEKYASIYWVSTQRRKTQINYHLIHLIMESSKMFFRSCTSNGMREMCVCLQRGKCKQDHHFFYQTAFIFICASDYRANTIPWLIY